MTRLVLSREVRAQLFAGGAPRIAFPAKAGEEPPVEIGEVVRLSNRLSLEVTGIRRSKRAKDFEVEYKLRDSRETFLRQGLPRRAEVTDNGRPPDAAEIERARLEGAYTQSRHLALRGEPEAVPPEVGEALSMARKVRAAEYRRRDRGEEMARDRTRVLARTVRGLAVSMVRADADAAAVGLFADLERLVGERQAEWRERDGQGGD